MRQPVALVALALTMLALSAADLARTDVAAPARAQGDVPADPKTIKIAFDNVVGGVDIPVDIANAGDGSGRLFVVEKPGRIRVVKGGQLVDRAFLDLTDRVESAANERGLLGLVFHPRYEENGRFFVYYTTKAVQGRKLGSLVIASFQVTADADVADPASESVILNIDHGPTSRWNHNGGNLAFGPDGYLYIGTGDGGGGGDPDENGQNVQALLAKLLRIDIDNGSPYGIPPTNPFVNLPRHAPEIWAYGLRNPWRFAFDGATGDLYIADVGQNMYEEVNFQAADSKGGENYGWNVMEGLHCYNADTCDRRNKVLPVAEYDHNTGLSITGGEVYRGRLYPGLNGTYFYADYSRGHVWALSRDANGRWRNAEVLSNKNGITSWGLDENGEIYIALETGRVQRLRDANANARPTSTPTDPPQPTSVPATTQPPEPTEAPTATPPEPTHSAPPPAPTSTPPVPTVLPLEPWIALPALYRAYP